MSYRLWKSSDIYHYQYCSGCSVGSLYEETVIFQSQD